MPQSYSVSRKKMNHLTVDEVLENLRLRDQTLRWMQMVAEPKEALEFGEERKQITKALQEFKPK